MVAHRHQLFGETEVVVMFSGFDDRRQLFHELLLFRFDDFPALRQMRLADVGMRFPLDLGQSAVFRRSHKRDRGTGLADPAGPTDPVHVRLGPLRQ
ncbi:hypothetical protein SDC9_203448 [bioreactor metagenome]|uniref:Uncharacterized protein n=1 Tax=bioreactor metagenome TaxID=1076179 RepID=A0A645J5L5_9ZZZZ